MDLKQQMAYEGAEGKWYLDKEKALKSFGPKNCSCGKPIEGKYTSKCLSCQWEDRQKWLEARWNKLREAEWDEKNPIVEFDGDTWFYDYGEVQEWLEENELEEARFVHSDRVELQTLDTSYWADIMPPDVDEFPKELEDLVKEFNEKLSKIQVPYYEPSKLFKITIKKEKE